MAHIKEFNLRALKRLRSECDWNIENQRLELLRELLNLFDEWFGRRPNLLDIFRTDEIDWLISKAIENWTKPDYGKYKLQKFIYFIVRTGYEDPLISDWKLPRALLRTTPVHLAHRHNCFFLKDQLFQIYKYYVNYADASGLTHFQIACKWGCTSVVAGFLQFRHDPNNCFALHLALKSGHVDAARLLLKNGANPNLATEADGSTPLHVICQRDFRDSQDLVKFFVETSEDELNREVQIDARDKSGKTPLHLALERDLQAVAESLLRNGASPNVANAEGMTPLHIICASSVDKFYFMEKFFAINDKMCQEVEVNARNNRGYTPLLLAFERRHYKAVEVLLRRGADPNLANDDGMTPLHFICGRIFGPVRTLLELIERYPLQLDAQDVWGNTPLHRAIEYGNIDMTEYLLRRGANPNSANNKGVTPTHLASGRINVEVLKLFFKVNDDIQNAVRVDARDNNGLTPLQWAVSKLVPDAIDLILNRGADLSSFVFPTFDLFDEGLKSLDMRYQMKLALASGLVAVVERLEEKGYELDRSDALTIMRLFAKYELLKTEDDSWHHNEECSTKMIMIKPNLSLYDLIQLPPKQAGKLITDKDCMDFARSCQLGGMPDGFRAKCYAQLFVQLRDLHCLALAIVQVKYRNHRSKINTMVFPRVLVIMLIVILSMSVVRASWSEVIKS
ncbi:unnamed protein product [Trichogramma brassicae]|uniref:Uncharacterized protein n=1 Tax=Trichogramma brassicae TaxID=86971 RepID=A0A6H5IAA7_9HYME|nr:unnamed protein product [Trichogramma brassicae]